MYWRSQDLLIITARVLAPEGCTPHPIGSSQAATEIFVCVSPTGRGMPFVFIVAAHFHTCFSNPRGCWPAALLSCLQSAAVLWLCCLLFVWFIQKSYCNSCLVSPGLRVTLPGTSRTSNCPESPGLQCMPFVWWHAMCSSCTCHLGL